MSSIAISNSGSTPKSIVCLGEAVIDFVATEPGPLANAKLFEKAAGGAPVNVAIGLARLGVPSAFIGKLGDEAFGHYVAKILREEGVDVSGVVYCAANPTCFAFVSLTEQGDRDFLFGAERSSDTFLSVEELNEGQILTAAALHVGSFSLRHEPARTATHAAVLMANRKGIPVSFDPNLRLTSWPSQESLIEQVLRMWRLANIIKVSDEEILFLSKCVDRKEAASRLWHDQLLVLAVTLGSRGAEVYTSQGSAHVPSFPVNVVDTTGAGDGFVAGLLSSLVGKTNISLEDAIEACRRGNIVGGLATTRRGAISALPRLADLPPSAPI